MIREGSHIWLTDLLHNTSSLVRLVRITIVSQGYILLGSVQFWSAWFEFSIGCFLAPSLGILSLNYTTLVFVSLISCICQLFRKYGGWLRQAFFLKLLKTNCDFWSVVTRLRFFCIRAEAFSHMENRQWQKLAEKKSRHSQKSHEMYWNIIVYPFNCLSWSILIQRDEKYGYSVTNSRWCVRVLFLFMIYLCPFIFTFMAYSPPYFSVNGMMILVLAYKNGFKSKSVYYGL